MAKAPKSKGAGKGAAQTALNPNAKAGFEGRAFLYTYEMATGQVVTRGDSMCRDKHPFHVRQEFLASNTNVTSCVLLNVTEIDVADYEALLPVLSGEAETEGAGNA